MDSLNIFSAISSYPYNPEHNPWENQHTAFFAFILNNDKNLLKFLLEKLLKNKSKLLNTIIRTEDFDNVIIQEAEALDGNKLIPDMKISTIDTNLTIYIENKIKSSERKNQLNDYLELAKRNSNKENSSNKNFVIYLYYYYESISKNIEEHQNFGGKFTWGQISDILEEYTKLPAYPDSQKYDFTSQFIKYMEESGLRGTKGFKKEYSEAWNDFIEFAEIREEYLKDIINNFKNDGYSVSKGNSDIYSIRSIYKTNWNTKSIDDGFWINIGFELVFETLSESDSIVLIAQLGCGKRFFENVKNEFSKDLKKAEFDLVKKDFSKLDSKDPIIIDSHIILKEITEDYNLSKEEQIEKINEWVKYRVNELESSELLKLLELNYPQLA